MIIKIAIHILFRIYELSCCTSSVFTINSGLLSILHRRYYICKLYTHHSPFRSLSSSIFFIVPHRVFLISSTFHTWLIQFPRRQSTCKTVFLVVLSFSYLPEFFVCPLSNLRPRDRPIISHKLRSGIFIEYVYTSPIEPGVFRM